MRGANCENLQGCYETATKPKDGALKGPKRPENGSKVAIEL
jgi:hypothetical protein